MRLLLWAGFGVGAVSAKFLRGVDEEGMDLERAGSFIL